MDLDLGSSEISEDGVAAAIGTNARDPGGGTPQEQQQSKPKQNFQKTKGRKRKGPIIARKRKNSSFDYNSMRSAASWINRLGRKRSWLLLIGRKQVNLWRIRLSHSLPTGK